VPHLAAELLLPGQSARHQRARPTVCSNVLRLFQILRDRDVRIVAIEHPINREFELEIGAPLVSLNGSIDLLGELPDGRRVVIDLKWTTSDKIYRERIEAGEAFQLATYAWALNAEAVAGYFMLRQGVLLTDSDELGDKLTSSRSLDQVWDVGIHTARLRLAKIRSGFVECYSEWQQRLSQQALGRGESQSRADDALTMQIRGAGEMYSRPACHYGQLGSLCGQLEEQR
jgi:ATP-dependent helicase/nuclease subunit B